MCVCAHIGKQCDGMPINNENFQVIVVISSVADEKSMLKICLVFNTRTYTNSSDLGNVFDGEGEKGNEMNRQEIHKKVARPTKDNQQQAGYSKITTFLSSDMKFLFPVLFFSSHQSCCWCFFLVRWHCVIYLSNVQSVLYSSNAIFPYER